MNNTLAGVRLVTVAPDHVASFRDGIVDVYRRVFTESPWDETTEQAEEFGDSLVEWRASPPGSGWSWPWTATWWPASPWGSPGTRTTGGARR